jgi:hypothetical protein
MGGVARRRGSGCRRAGGAALAVGLLLVAGGGRPAAADEAHLPFFEANRDWLLRAFEALPRPDAAPDARARAWSFDPFADASALAALQAVRAGLDTATTLADLGPFRTALDSLLAAAETQAGRLDDLDRRFAAHLRTALEVTLAVRPQIDVERVEAWLDGVLVQQHTLSPEERAALAAGGALEILRRVVEPRAQSLEVRAWAAGDVEPSRTALVVDPAPDILTIWHLDLDSARSPARLQRTALGGQD